jgi:hypothetical protein
MMFFMWIIPLALIALVVYAIVGNKPITAPQPAASRVCANCKQQVQNDWKNCPHCGQSL